ncbi:Slowmo [Perkinsus olseni]|uniref:Slowmo n=1 Tax=Perkinsus olseni TaxID=32597 RepID=A0A7J6TE03_PEROL|nr:Slowmo [Perkinsus olseni]KAF4753601.1 Slowmo [Perkinsus olseni]
MRFFERTHTFPYDWETCTSAWWTKYPNPEQPHVKEVDTLCREVDQNAGRLRVRRLFYLEYDLPSWVRMMYKRNMEGYAVEDVECDVRNRVLVAKGSNYTFSSFFRMQETITYQRHPDNPEWTLYRQRMNFTVSGLGVLCGRLEQAARDSSAQKAHNGVTVMNNLIERLHLTNWKADFDCWRQEVSKMTDDALEKGRITAAEAAERLRRFQSEAKGRIQRVESSFINRVARAAVHCDAGEAGGTSTDTVPSGSGDTPAV